MQLDVLREFIVLAKTLNYHTAAKELHISQPTLSNHISALEKELAFPLIDRSHGMSLTVAGAEFLKWAAGVIVSYDTTLERCKSVSRQTALSFSVQVPRLTDRNAVTFVERIHQFKNSHPQVIVRILPARDKFVLDEIRDGYCDCALFVQQVSAPEIDSEYQGIGIASMFQEEAVAWVKKDGPLGNKPNLSMQDVAESVIPVHVNDSVRIWEMALHNDFQVLGLKPNLSYRYATTPEEFVLSQLNDDDVLLLPSGYLDTPLYKLRDDLVAVRLDPPVIITSFVAYNTDKTQTALQEFIRYIEAVFSESVLETV